MIPISDKFAKYALNLVAINIVLLGYIKINWNLRGAKKYNGKNLNEKSKSS